TRTVSGAFQSYIQGLFQAPRGTQLRMSEGMETDSQALNHLLTEASVDWKGLTGEIARQADALLGGDDSALILDESAFAKKGQASAGVARQWNGRLGKVDNAQVGVFSALCRGRRVTLLDSRLYLPKSWVEDEARCQRARVPEEARQMRSKCTRALELVDAALTHGVRFGYVVVDGGYGKDPGFLRGLASRSLCFVADVHKDQRIWLNDPEPYVPPASGGRGRRASKRRTEAPGQTVAQWARQQSESAWKRITLRQGEKGRLRAEYLHTRVWVWDGKEEQARCWRLLVRRECGAKSPSHYVLSNADEIDVSRLARMQGRRFFIEHAFREAKSDLAMADYQVRRWDAWHRHMALVMIAMLFVVKERLLLKQEAPLLSLADVVMVLEKLLPKPEPTPKQLARLIQERHRRRQAATESCRRRG
ncbi:IS701 family transposase, partial [Thiolapillus sp.]